MSLPQVLHGPRLDLALVSVEQILSRDGRSTPLPLDFADDHDILNPATSPLNFRIEQLRKDPSVNPWLIRLAVLRDPRPKVVGLANFHDAPDVHGMVEIGYQVLPQYRQLGFGREVAYTMWDCAVQVASVKTLRASISPDNAPSIAIITTAGFVKIGEQDDPEDGLELIFELAADTWRNRKR